MPLKINFPFTAQTTNSIEYKKNGVSQNKFNLIPPVSLFKLE